jgi:hypothetical protein
MRDTILKDCLLPFYKMDESQYNLNVSVIVRNEERTFDFLSDYTGKTATTKNITIVFQDEALNGFRSNGYMNGCGSNGSFTNYPPDFDPNAPLTSNYITDIANIRSKLNQFSSGYYRGIIMQVINTDCPGFLDFLKAVKYGTGNYSGTNGLSDKPEITIVENVVAKGEPLYYANLIITALNNLGYSLELCE